jgi:hypothetical protein
MGRFVIRKHKCNSRKSLTSNKREKLAKNIAKSINKKTKKEIISGFNFQFYKLLK